MTISKITHINIPRILAIDPGEMIGTALFDTKGDLVNMYQITREAFTSWLETQNKKVDLLVVEDYRLFKHKALQQSGSRLGTVKCIGAIESFAERNSIKVVLQPANILPIAEKLVGIKRPKNHAIGHQVCAMLHGNYYLIKNNYKEVIF